MAGASVFGGIWQVTRSMGRRRVFWQCLDNRKVTVYWQINSHFPYSMTDLARIRCGLSWAVHGYNLLLRG